MDMKPRLGMEMRQQLVITQKVQLMLKFLQIPTLELQQVLHQEILTNPVLELEEEDAIVDEQPKQEGEETPIAAPDSPEEFAVAEKSEEEPAEADWSEFYTKNTTRRSRAGRRKRPNSSRRSRSRGRRLQESLREQLRLMVNGEKEEQLAEYMIGMIDDRGYLVAGEEEIAKETGADVE